MIVVLLDVSILRKRAKLLLNMARPDGLEPPTTWFEARYPYAIDQFLFDTCS